MGLLEQQVAFVTGAGTGIGKATSLSLAAEGARVVLVGRRPGPLEEVEEEIARSGGEAYAHSADVTSESDLQALVEWALASVGPPRLVVNCAGWPGDMKNILWLDEAEWNRVMEVNLTSVFLMSRYVLPSMIESGGGTIVTVSSQAAARPTVLGGVAYSAAKAGVNALMEYINNTFRNDMIRAVRVSPGEIDTPMIDIRAHQVSAETRSRMAQPEDVAQAILMCCALPQRALIRELVLEPTFQRDVSADMETSRWFGAPTAGK